MPDQTQSERLMELRSVFPANTREIQTIQISQPDVLIPKTLQVCFVIDTWYSSSAYQQMVQRVIDKLGEIRSELDTTYESVRWALVSVAGTQWELLTGSNFVGYSTFAARLAELVLVSNATQGEIYKPVIRAAETLNWLPDSDFTEKHMVYLGDTANQTTTYVLHTSSGNLMSVIVGGSTTSFLQSFSGETLPYLSLVEILDQSVTIIGFANSNNNGTFQIENVTSSDFSRILQFDNDLPHPSTTETIGATVTARFTQIVNSADTPTLAIAALTAAGIKFNQAPTFVNAHLTSMVTGTGGTSLSQAQMATLSLVQQNLVSILSNTEYFSSGVDPIYLTNDNRNLTALLENAEEVTFLRRSFAIDPFSSGEEGSISIPIKIDNSDLAISQYLASAKSTVIPIEVVIRIYEEGDTTGPQNNPPLKLYATEFESKGSVVSCQLSWIDLHNAVFPNEFYTPTKCPSLQ